MTTGSGAGAGLAASWTLAVLTTFMVMVRVSQEWELSSELPAHQIYYKSPFGYTSSKRFHHQQQRYQNDLQPQLSSLISSHSSDRDRVGLQESGGRPVINGNHATYVEPPADFKPIIYGTQKDDDHDDGDHDDEQANSRVPTSTTSTTTTTPHTNKKYETSNVINQISGTSGADYLGQQNSNSSTTPQQREQQLGLDYNVPSASSMESGELDNGDDSLDAATTQQLKPSIGRWSDWHDMSIEPDLASSDSQQLAAGVMQQRKQQQQQQQPLKGNLYTSPLSPSRVAGKTATTTTTTRYEWRVDNSERSPAMQQQISGNVAAAAPGFLPLMNSQPSYYMASPGNLINTVRHSFNRPQNQEQQQQQQQPFYLMSPASHALAEPLALPLPHFFLARSQFELMPPSPLPLPLLNMSGSKNNLFAPLSSSSSLAPPSPPQSTKGHRQPQRRKSKNAEVHRVVYRVSPAAAAQLMTQRPAFNEQQQPVSAPLMSSPIKKPLSERAILLTPSGQKVSGKQATTTNSTTPVKRVLKRRRIKTLLPVGLSSWMLGGIRDLDARHWKLPSDVISKLAVNDVDLAHSSSAAEQPITTTTTTATATTGDSSTSIQSALEQAGPPLISSSSTQRVPNSQLIPR